MQLSTKQKEIALNVYGSSHTTAVDGIIGCGKTTACISGAMGRVSKHFTGGTAAGVVRSKRQWRDVLIPEFTAWCRRNGHSYKATDEVFTVASSKGGTNRIVRVIANDRTSIDTIMGMNLIMAYVDEAPKMSADFLQALDGRLRVPGAKMVMSFNPEGGKRHWFYEQYIKDADQKKIDYHRVLLKDNANPSLPPCLLYTSDAADE